MRKLVITVILAGVLAMALVAPAFADSNKGGVANWKHGCNSNSAAAADNGKFDFVTDCP